MRANSLIVLGGVLLFPAVSAQAADINEDPRCLVIHYYGNGSRTETAPTKSQTKVPKSGESTAHASSVGNSSVRASANSTGSNSSASASSRSDGNGRMVTRTDNEEGCTIFIDERPIKDQNYE